MRQENEYSASLATSTHLLPWSVITRLCVNEGVRMQPCIQVPNGQWRSAAYGRYRLSKLQVTLDQFAEFLAVFVFHVYEFHAVAVGSNVANDGGEMNLLQPGANFQLDRIADGQFLWRLEI